METICYAASTQTALNHTLSRIADTTKIWFQILKQITGGQVIIVCRVIWLYAARVMTVCWVITDLWTGL